MRGQLILCGFPARSAAVDLGGATVPKQKLVVYILIGHSNMAGWSEISGQVTHPRGWHRSEMGRGQGTAESSGAG